MSERHRPLRRCVAVTALAALALALAACQRAAAPQAERRCGSDHKQSHHVLLSDRRDVHERLIASLTAFAKSKGLDPEANRYPQGVPGNTRPQFLASVCDEHFYALAGNHEPGFITVKMFSDKLQHEAGIDPLAVSLAVRLKSEFTDVWLGSDLNDGFLERSGARASESRASEPKAIPSRP